MTVTVKLTTRGARSTRVLEDGKKVKFDLPSVVNYEQKIWRRGSAIIRQRATANGQMSLDLSGGGATVKTRDAAATGLRYEKSLSGLYLGGNDAI